MVAERQPNGTQKRSFIAEELRPEHFVFADYWLRDYAHLPQMPVLLFQNGTSIEKGSAVRFTGEHPLARSYDLPLPQFMQAVGEFRDMRSLGDDFPQHGGFEDDSNRQRLVDALNKPVWFAFDALMVHNNSFQIEGDVLPESDREGLLSRITGIPVERAYVLVLQTPTRRRLKLSNLIYAAR